MTDKTSVGSSKDVVRWRHRPEHGDIIRSAWGDFVRYDDIKHLLPTDETRDARDIEIERLRKLIETWAQRAEAEFQSKVLEVDWPKTMRNALKANACQCDPNPSIGGSPPCPVHDGESEDV